MRPRKQGNNRTVEIPFHAAFQRSSGRGPPLGALMNPPYGFLGLSLLHKHKNMKRSVSEAREERAWPSSGCPVLISVSILKAPSKYYSNTETSSVVTHPQLSTRWPAGSDPLQWARNQRGAPHRWSDWGNLVRKTKSYNDREKVLFCQQVSDCQT